MKRRVVVTGMGVISPVGNSLDTFWKSLVAGHSAVERITSFDCTAYDTKIAAEVKDFDPSKYLNPKEIKRTDRFAQFAIAASKLAVAESGLDLSKEDRFRVGVLVGSGIGGIHTIFEETKTLLSKGPSRISPFFIPMLITNMASGVVSIALKANGPNTCAVTACATGTHCIGDAMRIIQHGDADIMVAGGTEAAINELGVGGFCASRALSTRNDDPKGASRPFDKNRDGFVMGEGAGVLVLEELEHAKRRRAHIYAELAGYGMTGDAYHMTAPAPDGLPAAKAMEVAIKDAHLNPSEIDYINAHGTSTQLNDKVETIAIKIVFGDYAKKVAISSTKSMIGHLLGAAGGVELIAAILSIKNDSVHPTINYTTPDPECDLDYVPNQARQMRVRAALSNSLGFGGHNACLVVKKFH